MSKSTTSKTNEFVDVPMCRHVCELLPPTRQAHLRSAGSVGYDAFEELVALGDVPVYVEVVTVRGSDDARFGALMNAPIQGVKKPMRRKPKRQVPDEHVIVFWERAMRRRLIPQPHWSKLPWVSIRYHYDVHADRSCSPHNPMYAASDTASVMGLSRATHVVIRGFGDEDDESLETPFHLLRYCPNLKVIDLSDLRNVKVINDTFIYSASAPVDLSPFTKVHTIKTAMLVNYPHDSIDLSPLRNVIVIKDSFMTGSSMKSIDLSPFAKLECIGNGFLSGSEMLECVDLNPLVSIKSVGAYFLIACPKLTNVDLRPLRAVTQLGSCCLGSCSSLTSVLLPTFEHLDVIGTHFLSTCNAIQDFDLSPLHNMTTIPSFFLTSCKGLTSLDLSPFSSVTGVGHGFLSGCSGLTSIDLKPFHNVRPPLKVFLEACTGITHLDMSPLVSLTRTERKMAMGRMFNGEVTYGPPTNSCCIM